MHVMWHILWATETECVHGKPNAEYAEIRIGVANLKKSPNQNGKDQKQKMNIRPYVKDSEIYLYV